MTEHDAVFKAHTHCSSHAEELLGARPHEPAQPCLPLLALRSLKRWRQSSRMTVHLLQSMRTVRHRVLACPKQEYRSLQMLMNSRPWKQSPLEGQEEP